ncbi:MAG: MarR family EPS-associated transcriptional regulator [Candidatus Omnitrophota bacterium]
MDEHYFQEDVFKILKILSTSQDLTQRDLSEYLNISLGKTNYLLKALTQRGLVKIKNFTSRKGKLNKLRYILTKNGFEKKITLARYFLEKKEKEYFELKKELELLNSGVVNV